jgi:hypothetical protein
MEDEAKEIAELEAQQRGESTEDTEQEVVEEETPDTEVEETTLSAEEKSFKKRYGDLRRHMQQKEKEWDEKLENLQKASAKAGIIPPKSDEDIEEWAKEYPDVAGIVETIAAKKAQEMFDKADTRLKQLDEAHAEAHRVKSENEIRKSHSDFDELREADEFHDWADAQPKWVKDALYENADDPASVVRVIDLYKSDKGLTKEAKKASKKAAASPVARRSKAEVDVADSSNTIRESEVAKMTDKEFEERADEINKAMRTGKFVYDVSGNAR